MKTFNICLVIHNLCTQFLSTELSDGLHSWSFWIRLQTPRVRYAEPCSKPEFSGKDIMNEVAKYYNHLIH
jgi:hypothetical protein